MFYARFYLIQYFRAFSEDICGSVAVFCVLREHAGHALGRGPLIQQGCVMIGDEKQ